MIFIREKVMGELSGVKSSAILELESLYGFRVEGNILISLELAQKISSLSWAIQREIAIYLNRRGQVTAVAVGDHDTVGLPDFQGRHGANRLSGIRCIHTHLGASGQLSTVDWTAMATLNLDCMAAIGVQEGNIVELYIGFVPPGGEYKAEENMLLGPLKPERLEEMDILEAIRGVESIKPDDYSLAEKDTGERALLVGLEVPRRQGNGIPAKESLEELASLAETAGAVVLAQVIQNRQRKEPAYYVGQGLAKELSLLRQELGANLVIFDEELSGTQIRNLEGMIGVKVLDRTALILDIFAQRARSREGKLQVELAQLEYSLPRLIGRGIQLSRLAGGIGTRGPGESKLETDRRHIRERISELKSQLNKLQERRKLHREGRKYTMPTVALVGYTNAGKSTLRYRLLQCAASTGGIDWEREDSGTDKLFATLDPTVRGVVLPDGREVLFSDTVGFIQKLPHRLISAFRATLEEVVEADLLVHVVDMSSPLYTQQMDAVYRVLDELGAASKPRITVYNKIDLVSELALPIPPDNSLYVAVSALDGRGVEELLTAVSGLLPAQSSRVCMMIPYEDAGTLSRIYAVGKVIKLDYETGGIMVEAVVNNSLLLGLEKYRC
ncbi:MAG: GTPase HflX [Bacillota bacterium]